MKKLLFSTILCLSLCLLAGNVMAQSTATATATPTGSGSWTVPAGVWKIVKLEAYGAGGGGGNATSAHSVGAGGGSGAYASTATNISVIPGSNVLDYSVGAAGTGGQRGGTSYVKESVSSSSYYVRATGGYAGATATIASEGSTATSTATATSTLANADYGETKTSGKKGSDGTIKRTRSGWGIPIVSPYSYSFSGTGAAGGNNVSNTGGGSSRTSSGAGNGTTTVGAGGGGALNLSSSSQSSYTGGQGGPGRVIITYEKLTLHVTINANGGTTTATDFDILYYDQFGSKLPDATLDGYTFLGWFTEGGVKMTADSLCKETADFILKAHFLKSGAIANGPLTASPCQSFTVFNETTPDTRGDAFTYSWSYTVNGGTPVELNVNKNQLTEEDLTLDQMGTYVFTRYVNVFGQTVASSGNYTINVSSVDPGEIATAEQYTCPAGAFTIGSTTNASTTSVGTIVYEWRYTKDGGSETAIASSNKTTLTEADFTPSAGTYVFKRYATIGCATPMAATGEYTLYVTALPAKYDMPDTNFTSFCEGGTLEVTGEDYSLSGLGDNGNGRRSWMIIENGGTPQDPDKHAKTYEQTFTTAPNTYGIYCSVVFFSDAACVVNTDTVMVNVVADPTIAVPTLSSTSVCPNGTDTLMAANIIGGAGAGYTYNWEFKAAGSDTWQAISASEATYSSITGDTIEASNFMSTGNVQYRSFISNDRGCDAYSPAANLNIIEVEPPIVRGDTICPVSSSFIEFKATKTNPSYVLYWYENATTSVYTEITPQVPTDNELEATYYVAQYNPDNRCVSARLPDAIYITYSAHLQYVDASGDLDQVVCQNNGIVDIQFNHGGDCEPQITWNSSMPDGITIDNSVAGETHITGTPTEAGEFSYRVKLEPDGTTLCAAPNYYDGIITVNPVYDVTESKAICGGSYTISDQKEHSYSFSESGTYTETLEAVTGCDSVVTLNLYVHEWNQFGFKEDEELIAGWTSFSSVASPISADVAGSVSGSQITYSGWNGGSDAVAKRDNLTSTSSPMVNTAGSSLGLLNGVMTGNIFSGCSINYNDGKSIVLKTSTSNYGNIKLHFDYELECTGATDHAFSKVQISYGFDGSHFTNFSEGSISVSLPGEATFDNQSGSFDLDLSNQSSNAVDNVDNLYVKLEFNGSARSLFTCLSAFDSYFRIDNICFSGSKPAELEVKGKAIACTNQPFTVEATPPYINTLTTPPDTTPVIYKWERVVSGVSTVLDETSSVLIDNTVPAGNYQYKVSVGESPCGQSATWDVQGIEPAVRLDIIRHAHVCSNELEHEKNITFEDADCPYVDGMFIVTPALEDMRTPGVYDCQLSIPTNTNPCDSVITLRLNVLKSFDTTIVANICLGESYTEYGFDITPTVEGVTYYTSPDTWKCASGCDSVYRLTLITNSVRNTLTSESGVILAAWPMDNGITNFIPACGKKTVGSTFKTGSSLNSPKFDKENNAGNTPSADYCYEAASDNRGLRWPNLSSEWSGSSWFGGGGGEPTYTDYRGVYLEIKLNPFDYENLKLKFDYKRENASTSGAQALDKVNYYYKLSEAEEYSLLGSANITSTSWSSQTLNFSSVNTLNENEVYLKVEFVGGNPGNTEDGGNLVGKRYLPSYITVDNVMIWGDRPARASLDGTAQKCNDAFVCEGGDATFTCQGDDNYFKFYVVDETTNVETAFDGNTTLTITPTQTTSYIIKAEEQTTMCDSIWGPFNVEVVKSPTISYLSGTQEAGLCGNDVFDIQLAAANAPTYEFKWLQPSFDQPTGITYSVDNTNHADTTVISLGGTLTGINYAEYKLTAYPDDRCPSSSVSVTGSMSVRVMPTFEQTIGEDTVCQGADMQYVISNKDALNFTLVPEIERYSWTTADVTLGNTDTLEYVADEAIHSTRHYLTVKQNGCTTIDSFDVVVYNLASDTLNALEKTYVFNYGDNYLPEDSLVVPDLMHNGEVVPQSFIASVAHTGGAKIYPNNMTDLIASIEWTITDKCGNEHKKTQILHFELPPCGGDMTVTDKNGNEYQTVRMGLNCWMKENLKATLYADETVIPVAMGYKGGDFNDTAANANTYGRLYSWYSAVKIPENSDATVLPQTNAFGHVQGVCPDGWCLPNRECFASLHDVEMNRMRKAGDEYWYDGGGNNTTGFSLVGAGFYNISANRFENLLGNTYFWTSDVYDDIKVKSFEADCHCYMWQEIYQEKGAGFSVRCIKDKD